jgi:hypothetical protein
VFACVRNEKKDCNGKPDRLAAELKKIAISDKVMRKIDCGKRARPNDFF